MIGMHYRSFSNQYGSAKTMRMLEYSQVNSEDATLFTNDDFDNNSLVLSQNFKAAEIGTTIPEHQLKFYENGS